MEEVEGSIFNGDIEVASGVTVLLDVLDAEGGTTGSTGWHAHVALPLSAVVQPGEQMRLVTADGRSGAVELLERPTLEGDRALHVFTGVGPLQRAGA